MGNPELQVKRVALCTGSGSSLMGSFFSSKADVYVSGDLRYHDARAVEAVGLGMIDIGHFASERLMIDILANKLQNILTEKGIDIKINKCKIEKDPFKIF